MPDRSGLSSQEEYSFSLMQYMVVLDKPIGLTLAPDPRTGQVFVQHIEPGMAAAESRLVLVGDRLVSCSAVFGDEMWLAHDLQRTRWAINNRPGKVKLVLERSEGGTPPPWFFRGREGIATWEVPELQLPIRFVTPVGGELAESVPGVGRSLTVSFNRCMGPAGAEQPQRPALRSGFLARCARAEALLRQLAVAAEAPEVDVSSPESKLLSKDGGQFQVGVSGTLLHPGSTTNVLPFRRPGGGSIASGGSAAAPPAGSNNTAAAPPPSNSNNSSSNSSSNSSNSSNSTAAAPLDGKQAGGSGAAAGANPAAAAAAAAAWGGSAAPPPGPSAAAAAVMPPHLVAQPVHRKRVVQVLPWLLVSDGFLNIGDIGAIATNRALGCLLELRLSLNAEGLVCPGASQPPPFTLPAEPAPPTLSPSATPKPAPDKPPPLPPAAQQERLQQQEQERLEQQQQQQLVQERQAQLDQESVAASNSDADADVLSLAGIAGPDVGFATAAAAAAAAAAAISLEPPAQQQQQQQQASQAPARPGGGEQAAPANADAGGGGGGEDAASGGGAEPPPGESSAAADGAVQPQQRQPQPQQPLQPSKATLVAHAVLHCVADLHRLTVRRHWTPHGGIGWQTAGLLPKQQQQQQHPAAGWPQQLPSGGGGGRRGGSKAASADKEVAKQPSSQLLLNCQEGSWGDVGLVLAAWLHWGCGVDLATASESVSEALGVKVDQAVLDEARRLLVVRARERFSRLMLKWPYGGTSAEVSGDLVGGWTERVAMRRCTSPDGCLGASQGHFYLELQGLNPGSYHYKFIVDNTWAVDSLAPKALDSQGNWNNVLNVAPPPRIETEAEQSHYASLQLLCMALDRKLRPRGRLL